jgi:hypothetical protein
MDTYMEIEFRYLEHSGLTFNGKIVYVMLKKEFKELLKFLETMVTGSCASYIKGAPGTGNHWQVMHFCL